MVESLEIEMLEVAAAAELVDVVATALVDVADELVEVEYEPW